MLIYSKSVINYYTQHVIILFLAILATSHHSYADTLVNLNGAQAVLTLPAGKPVGSIILVPGSHGRLAIDELGNINKLRGNQLVRTRHLYANSGAATLTVDRAINIKNAIAHMRKISSPVIIVATSRGATRIHKALAARPDGLVLTAAMLDRFTENVGNPQYLPKTLVIHHVKDQCHVTLPALVPPFKKWGGNKVEVKWIKGGCSRGRACKARSHHGFNCQDQQIVDIVISFLKKRK